VVIQFAAGVVHVVGDLIERRHDASSGWALDLEPIGIEMMEAALGFDRQIVGQHPNSS
jgi:hypothetical protein